MTQKCLILVLKEKRADVEDMVEFFMEDFYGIEFEYYHIGGRFSGYFTAQLLEKDKMRAVYREFKHDYGWWIGGEDQITEVDRRRQFHSIFYRYFPDFLGVPPNWREAKGGRVFKDDIKPLVEVLPIVQKWVQDPLVLYERFMNRAVEVGCGFGLDDFFRNIAYLFLEGVFCHAANVYNVTDESYVLPEDCRGWWAVVIDIHY